MAVSPQQPDLQLVTFFLGREEYGVDVMGVREIINRTEITKTANAPPHVEGIINLRGRIVPIVSLRKRLGLPEAGSDPAHCIAVLDLDGELSGFLIDEVSDVIRVSRGDLLPPLELAGQPWIQGILSLERRLVIVVNLAHLA